MDPAAPIHLPIEFVRTLSLWQHRCNEEGKSMRLFVGVDIGATNTRLALSYDTNGVISYLDSIIVHKFKAPNSITIITALNTFAQQILSIIQVDAVAACLAGAGRISEDGDSVTITNFQGEESDRMLRKTDLPASLFPIAATSFVNDLESTCHGVKALSDHNLLAQYFKTFWSTSAQIQNEQETDSKLGPHHYLVVAVGTGLGIALLLSLGRGVNKRVQVLPMEFGHSLFAMTSPGPLHDEEERLTTFLSQKLYNSTQAIEYEDIVSGRGLEATYQWVVSDLKEQNKADGLSSDLSAAAIADTASKVGEPGWEAAEKAILIHYRSLMRLLKNLTVGLLVKGIFLCGDNQVNNNIFVEKHLSHLQNEFLSHPKKEWLEEITLFAQMQKFNLNLHGTLNVAKSTVV